MKCEIRIQAESMESNTPCSFMMLPIDLAYVFYQYLCASKHDH